MSNLAQKPHELWSQEISEFLQRESPLLVNRYRTWMMLSENVSTESISTKDAPVFPLLPASRGFCLTLNKSLQTFERIVGVTLKKRGSSLDNPDPTLNVSHESNLSRWIVRFIKESYLLFQQIALCVLSSTKIWDSVYIFNKVTEIQMNSNKRIFSVYFLPSLISTILISIKVIWKIMDILQSLFCINHYFMYSMQYIKLIFCNWFWLKYDVKRFMTFPEIAVMVQQNRLQRNRPTPFRLCSLELCIILEKP